jgi:hypothetical protein
VARLVLAIGLALVLAAPALGYLGPETRRGDLDGDGQLETVRAVRVHVRGVSKKFDQTAIEVSDTCQGGGTTRRRIAGPQDNLNILRLVRADTHRGSEVFTDLRSGASGRLGEARLVAWRRTSGFPCRAPRYLFKYLSDHHTRTPPGGNGDISAFRVRVRELTSRFRGRELTLDERFTRKGEPLCCGSIEKLTYWRYSRSRDRYVRYRTVVKNHKPTGG